jgi:uncharacterized phage protein (TIGR02218 family)
MKFLDVNLPRNLFKSVQSLAYCWRLERTDGTILGFTSYDRDLIIDGITYKASSGIAPTAAEVNNKLEVSNISLVSFFLDSDGISEADILLGLYDYAKVQMFLVDYLDLPSDLTSQPYKHIALLEGTLGQITSTDKGFSVELRSLTQYLIQKKSQLTSPFCRYDFGDDNCTVNLASYTDTLTVDAAGDNQTITTVETLTPDKYKYGYLIFSSGVGAGKKLSISGNSTNSITLFEAAPWNIADGDQLEAVAGCDKTREACKSFSNILNFGGEPDILGVDEYLAGYQ